MSFRWVRTGDVIESHCTYCGLVIRERGEAVIYQRQRPHDVATCQQHRKAARNTDRGYRIDRIKYAMTESTTPITGATT